MFRKKCHLNDNFESNKPIIIVAIWGRGEGSKVAVKEVLHRWRASKVDVNSRGKPCKERMITILSETVTGGYSCESSVENDGEILSIEKMARKLASIGGKMWEEEFLSYIKKFGRT